MTEDEVYPNAPVVLVAIEARHPAASDLEKRSLQRAKQRLTELCPLYKPATFTTITAPPGAPPHVTTDTSPRFMSRDRTLAVTFRREALVIETTRHSHFGHLRDVLGVAVEARQDAGRIDGLDRLGLRYIDEIRVPDVGSGEAPWEAWVHPTLLGPASVGRAMGMSPTQWLGVAQFSTSDGNAVVVRYGPREGYAVDPSADLRRSTPPPGPLFVLDIDSYWEADEAVPPFETVEILTKADVLHAPIRTLFERLITDRLRDEVLRHAG